MRSIILQSTSRKSNPLGPKKNFDLCDLRLTRDCVIYRVIKLWCSCNSFGFISYSFGMCVWFSVTSKNACTCTCCMLESENTSRQSAVYQRNAAIIDHNHKTPPRPQSYINIRCHHHQHIWLEKHITKQSQSNQYDTYYMGVLRFICNMASRLSREDKHCKLQCMRIQA